MKSNRMTSFAEFWPYYLREHALPKTRALHYIGTTLVVLLIAAAIMSGHWEWALAIPFVGYGFAWFAHFAIENNRPATFRYPLWSLRADFVMWWYWLTQRLEPELRRAGVRPLEK